MRKLTILIDMDDTIENFCEVWVNHLNILYGTQVKNDDIVDWDMSKAFPSLSQQQLYSPIFTIGFWKDVRPLPGAVKYIKQLIEDGHRVMIVTASHPNTLQLKLDDVLFKYFPFLSINDVIMTSHKQLIRGDILIDDGPHNLENGEYHKILYSANHNRLYNAEANGMIRANNWKDVYNIINTISTTL